MMNIGEGEAAPTISTLAEAARHLACLKAAGAKPKIAVDHASGQRECGWRVIQGEDRPMAF